MLTVLLTATLWTSLSLALPAPHDIEQAVAQGHLSQAEQMLREVIAEKPGSAKAHYELAQVLAREGQHGQALQAIRQARELDPTLKFAPSPDKFKAVAQTIEQQAKAGTNHIQSAVSTAPQATITPTPAAAPDHAPTAWFWPVLLAGGLALLVLAWWRRAQSRPALQPAGMGSYAPEAPRGFGAQYDPRGAAPGYGNPYPSASPSAGSGVAGAVVGGLAGVAAGYALSKALEDHDRPAPHSDSATPRPSSPMDDMGVVRLDNAPGQDLGSFDAGAGDNWDAPAADDDNW